MELNLETVAALSGWLYLLVFAIAALDAMIPVMPSESVVITGALLAAHGDASIAGIAAAAALGALAGDLTSYALGRRAARRRHGVAPGGRTGRAMAWAQELLAHHGPGTLIVARFLPGGRTATTFTSGFVGMDLLPFVASIAAGAALWAGQAAGIGYLGGTVFEEHLLLGLALGLGSGLAVGLGVELVRSRLAARRCPVPAAA